MTEPPPPQDDQSPPRWPAWYAPVAFVAAFAVLLVLVAPLYALAGEKNADDPPAWVVIAATLVQGGVFIGVALLFASITRRPRAWHFGLRRRRFWPTVGWTAVGMAAFWLFALVYTALVQPEAEQTVTKDLGADEGALGLISAGVVVIVIAAVAEEFFFRGFFYRALRSRFAAIPAAALDGALFGLIHFDGADSLSQLPVLGALGFVFCLIYERTGTLYPVIALHALNNAIAYGVQADGWAVSAVVGPLMVAACALVPRYTERRASPAPAAG